MDIKRLTRGTFLHRLRTAQVIHRLELISIGVTATRSPFKELRLDDYLSSVTIIQHAM